MIMYLLQVPVDMGGTPPPLDLGFYKFLFLAALVLVAIISVFLIMGLNKAKKDEEMKLEMQEKQHKVMEEMLAVLKDIKAGLAAKPESAEEK